MDIRSPEFRFYYFTSRYEETVAFYRDLLQFEVDRSWDRGASDRGTIFRSPSGGGLIEIEAGRESPSLSGGFYIEVSDPDRWCARIRDAGGPIAKDLSDTSYGHRNFTTVDPSGVEISFFRYLDLPVKI